MPACINCENFKQKAPKGIMYALKAFETYNYFWNINGLYNVTCDYHI